MNEKLSIEFYLRKYIEDVVNGLDFKENFKFRDGKNNKVEDFFETIIIDDKYKLNIFKTKKQYGGSLCGFHSLFNITNFLKFKKSNHLQKKLYYLHKMNSTHVFWKFYSKNLKILLNSDRISGLDKLSLKENGPLERDYLKILLNNKKFYSDDENLIEVSSYFYGFNGFLGTSKSDLIEFQIKIEKFKNSLNTKNLILILILGTTSHWSVLIMEKCKNHKITFSYLDSHNINVFNLCKEDPLRDLKYLGSNHMNFSNLKIDAEKFYSEVYMKELESRNILSNSEWSRKCFIQWLIDINIVMRSMFKFIFEDLSVCDIAIECEFNDLFRTFEKCVCNLNEENKTVTNDIKIKLLIEWLNEEYHPKLLEEELFNLVLIFNYQEKLKQNVNLLKKLKKWIICCEVMKNCLFDDITVDREILIRFFYVLEKIKKFTI